VTQAILPAFIVAGIVDAGFFREHALLRAGIIDPGYSYRSPAFWSRQAGKIGHRSAAENNRSSRRALE
jgi:hypothetical protein